MVNRVLDWLGFGGHRAAEHDHGHGHTHGVMDAGIAANERGMWAIKWSFAILIVTGLLQIVVVAASHSVALLADTIHNFADATTALPLGVAFVLARRKPSARFPYGLGRVEDLAGLMIVGIILFSAVVAGYEAISRLISPLPVHNLGWLAMAGAISFLGNEVVAVLRIRVGREISSAALIADGYHARTDGLTSLAVVAGAGGVWLGFPLADPLIGLGITVAIFAIVWQSARSVLVRMLDGVEPGLLDEIGHAAAHVPGVAVQEARARWLGHRLQVELVLTADEGMLLAEANTLAARVEEELHHHLPALAAASIRFAPLAGGHHHAPAPFLVGGQLAAGVLQIVDTPDGERMQLRLSRHVEALQAEVGIARPSGTERLVLWPVAGNHHLLQSLQAPAEPHGFDAVLTLSAGKAREEVGFTMAEPHHHG